MEFVIAIALVAFFWYAAYKAWSGRVPKAFATGPTVVVSHNRRTAEFYMREFGLMFDKNTRLATRPEELYGYNEKAQFIYVNSDNGKPDPRVIQQLKFLEQRGAHVDWVGYEPQL